MSHPQCQECGRFIPYERATLCGGLDNFPSPSWEEWWEGLCEKCEKPAPTQPEGGKE